MIVSIFLLIRDIDPSRTSVATGGGDRSNCSSLDNVDDPPSDNRWSVAELTGLGGEAFTPQEGRPIPRSPRVKDPTNVRRPLGPIEILGSKLEELRSA